MTWPYESFLIEKVLDYSWEPGTIHNEHIHRVIISNMEDVEEEINNHNEVTLDTLTKAPSFNAPCDCYCILCYVKKKKNLVIKHTSKDKKNKLESNYFCSMLLVDQRLSTMT